MDGLNSKQFVILWVGALVFYAVVSYFLALVDHPQAYWLWHNVLGLVD